MIFTFTAEQFEVRLVLLASEFDQIITCRVSSVLICSQEARRPRATGTDALESASVRLSLDPKGSIGLTGSQPKTPRPALLPLVSLDFLLVVPPCRCRSGKKSYNVRATGRPPATDLMDFGGASAATSPVTMVGIMYGVGAVGLWIAAIFEMIIGNTVRASRPRASILSPPFAYSQL
jgi:hypothetical protein